jgi:hypothetical protein
MRVEDRIFLSYYSKIPLNKEKIHPAGFPVKSIQTEVLSQIDSARFRIFGKFLRRS